MILAWLGQRQHHWSGIQQSITDHAINQWQNRLNTRIKAKGKHFEYLL